MHLLLKRLYGSTSEKFDPRQGVLFEAQAGEEEAIGNSPAAPSGCTARVGVSCPETATGMAVGGFPTKSSGRNVSTT